MFERIERLGCDLLIKDLQHEPVFKRLPLPRQIAAAVDLNCHGAGEHLDDQVIHSAHALALQCNAELHLLHVYDAAKTHIADFGAGTVTMPGFDGSVRLSTGWATTTRFAGAGLMRAEAGQLTFLLVARLRGH